MVQNDVIDKQMTSSNYYAYLSQNYQGFLSQKLRIIHSMTKLTLNEPVLKQRYTHLYCPNL